MSKNYTAFCNIWIWKYNTYLDTSLERGTIVYDVGFLENSQQFKEITGVLVEHLQATFLKMKNSNRE